MNIYDISCQTKPVQCPEAEPEERIATIMTERVVTPGVALSILSLLYPNFHCTHPVVTEVEVEESTE